MNNIRAKFFTKAGLSACLFYLIAPTLFAQHFPFSEQALNAYQLALGLRVDEALLQVRDPKSPDEEYVVTLAQVLELLLTEDREKLSEYEVRFNSLPDRRIRKVTNEEYQFLMAETHLQWAFVYLKFGDEFEAAAQLRKAYHIAQACHADFPDFIPIKKTFGILQIIVGAVPEKYNWVLSLLGMSGSVDEGLRQLEAVSAMDGIFALEARLLLALTHGFILQDIETALRVMDETLVAYPENNLAQYLAATLAIKGARSERALSHLSMITRDTSAMPIHYAHYLLGEVYLHKADYDQAMAEYRWFIRHYKGQNYLKDAHYKIGLCLWMSGRTNDAEVKFREALRIGNESAEADRSAAMVLAQGRRPHVALTRARYAMDGGYFDEAASVLASLRDEDLPSRHDQVEYFYRKARLAHATGDVRASRLFYQQTIDLAGDAPWYFAPNSCLQLGYIFLDLGEVAQARQFFRRALSYKKHEYKNSIDSKARSALNRID